MWVLDTNTLIYFFKGEGRVASTLFERSPREIGIPAIVLFEIEVGISKSIAPEKRRRQLAELAAVVQILPFYSNEARSAAKIRATLEAEGCPIGPYDNLIAGTALALGATLVTRNVREFERVSGLRLEDWY